jgi:hypothetical protein
MVQIDDAAMMGDAFRLSGSVRKHTLNLQHVADKPGLLEFRKAVFTLSFDYCGSKTWPINSVRLVLRIHDPSHLLCTTTSAYQVINNFSEKTLKDE